MTLPELAGKTELAEPLDSVPHTKAATNGAAAFASAGTGKPMIELQGLRKVYNNGTEAVRDLNLTVRAGELFCVLGPNGAGKTTTIKMITGLLRPTEGRVLVSGFDIQNDPVQAKALTAYIPDHPYIYEKLTGREYFEFVADLFGVQREIWQERMDYFFDLFKLRGSIDTLLENYSHGMRQKLCFSVALMHSPKVIVVDEPFVGLDPESTVIVKRLLREECNKGACVFLSLHQLAEAEQMADRLVIYKKGSVIFHGTISDLRQEMNRHDARLEDIFLEMTMEDEG